jgi:hypothetical protein
LAFEQLTWTVTRATSAHGRFTFGIRQRQGAYPSVSRETRARPALNYPMRFDNRGIGEVNFAHFFCKSG